MLRKRIIVVSLIGLLFLLFKGWHEAYKPGYFPLKDVRMLGVVHTPVSQAVSVIGVEKGFNLLGINPEKVREEIEHLPWVRSARVTRQFPSTLKIRVVEKVAVGMGREKDRLVLLDRYGMVIKPLEKGDPLVFPVVVPARGTDKPLQVVWLINLLAKHPWIRERIAEAVGLPGGRWTLYTRRGVKLLFSKRTDQELGLLRRLHEHYAILDRKTRQIELRIPGRIAVRSAL